MRHVYVCHAGEDDSLAVVLRAGLEAGGFNTWDATRDITPASPYAIQTASAVAESAAFVLLISDASLLSHQVTKEIALANESNRPIIPLLVGVSQEHVQRRQPHWGEAIGVAASLSVEPNRVSECVPRLLQRLEALGVVPQSRAPRGEAAETSVAPLQVLDTITIPHGSEQSQIELCQGDLTNLQPDDAVDVLVVSAFRDDYTPMPGSLIGSLLSKGVSVSELASSKAVDLRQAFSCWMSREVLDSAAGIHFGRILCFEPSVHGTAAESVGDIFRALAPFVGGTPPVKTAAMPLVASGYQRVPAEQMLQLIVDAAAHWMAVGLPLTRLKIACLPGGHLDGLRRVFAELKTRYSRPLDAAVSQHRYDIFLSYAHANAREVAWLEEQLRERRPDIRLFIDRKELNVGSAWQREIFESLDDCDRVVAVYSPEYLASKVCLEEFNIALCRQRESAQPVLAPIYLYTAKLPTYMRLIQFWDCREFDRAASLRAVGELVGSPSQ